VALIVSIPVAPGELVDKIVILEIKSERIKDAAKLENVRREWSMLQECARVLPSTDGELVRLTTELRRVNERIWDLENAAREFERTKSFGDAFVAIVRQIYRANDERAALKRAINIHLRSAIVEEKSHSDY
jgi:Family of unknown function (DUF6165)